jgi:hypothetical protein
MSTHMVMCSNTMMTARTCVQDADSTMPQLSLDQRSTSCNTMVTGSKGQGMVQEQNMLPAVRSTPVLSTEASDMDMAG